MREYGLSDGLNPSCIELINYIVVGKEILLPINGPGQQSGCSILDQVEFPNTPEVQPIE